MVGMLRLLLIPVLTPTNAAAAASSSSIRSFAAAACHQLKRKKEKNKKRRHDVWQRWRSLSLQAGTDKHVAVAEKKIDSEKQQQCDFQAAALDVSFPTYMIWGANTGVGKTLVSAGIFSEFSPLSFLSPIPWFFNIRFPEKWFPSACNWGFWNGFYPSNTLNPKP